MGRGFGNLDVGAGGKDYVLGRFDPIATGVDARTDLNRAEDGVGAGLGLVGVLDEELGGEAQVFATALVEAGGARVAIDGAEIWLSVILVDQLGIAPGEEILFEVFAPGMVADDAFAGMPLESGRAGIVVAVANVGYGETAVEDIDYVVQEGVAGWDNFG